MNRWATLGTITLVLGGIGHFLIVDLPVMLLESSSVRWSPHSLLGELKQSRIDFGWLGQNNAFYIFSGFSLWVGISLLIIGLYNFLVFRSLQPGHKLRVRLLVLNLFVSAVFALLAALCFIYPPMVGGLLALLFFGLALRKEKELARSA